MFSFKLDGVSFNGVRRFKHETGIPLNCNLVIVEDEDSQELWVVLNNHTSTQTFLNLCGKLYTSHRKVLFINPHGDLHQEAAGWYILSLFL